MVLFLHALQICAIASVIPKLHGYVFLAANIDDFRSIANKFLPENVANKLIDLVVGSTATEAAIGRQPNGNEAPGTITNENSNKHNTNKRYQTISKADHEEAQPFKKALRQIETKIDTADKANIREEYENRLKQYLEDYTYSDDSKNNHETKHNGPFDEFREKKGEMDGREIEKDTKYDYTEAKLGEWNFNQQAHNIKPVDIEHVETGYTDTDSEMVSEATQTHNLDSNDNNMDQNKHLDGINEYGIEKDNSKTEKDQPREINNDKLHDSGSKRKTVTKNIHDNLYIKSLKNKDLTNIKPNEQPEIERDMYNDNVFESLDIHKRILSALREKKYSHMFASKKEDTDERNDAKHKHVRKPPKQLIDKPISYENSELDIITENKKDRNGLKRDEKEHTGELLKENDVYDKYGLGSKTKDSIELYKDRQKRKTSKPHIMKNVRHENDESDDKSENDKKKVSKHNNSKERPRKKPVHTNDMYDKYNLGSGTEDSEQKHSEHKNSYKTYKKQPIEENDMYDKYLLGSRQETKPKYIEKHPETSHINGDREKRKRKPHKKPIEQNDMFDTFKLGSASENDYEHSDYEKKRQRNPKNEHDLEPKQRKDKPDDVFINEHQPLRDKKLPFNEEFKKGSDEFTTDNIPTRTTELPGFVDDPLPGFKEVRAEAIQARTESLIDSDDGSFKMNGTDIPTRKVFKMSSPDYYKKLPRIVDKYDFDEPLPDNDRERDKVKYIKREPSSVNRKIKMPLFDSI